VSKNWGLTTGGVLNEKDLKEIAELSQKHDFYILSDEIYSRMVFGKSFKKISINGIKAPIAPSIASQKNMTKRTIVLDGFSKTYAMTGLRLGFAASKNKKYIQKLTTFAINLWSCLPEPNMLAALAALKGNQKHAQKQMSLYCKKRDVAVEMLNKINLIHCHKPKGAFYLFPNVTKVCKKLNLKDAESLRKYLLTYDKKNKKGVAVLARMHFGKPLAREKDIYIRLSVAGTIEDIKEGITRIKKAVEL